MRRAAAWAVTLFLLLIGPVAAQTITDQRLGMEFGPPPDGGTGAVILRIWNTQPLPDGRKPAIKPGQRVIGLSVYSAGESNLQNPDENYTMRRGTIDLHRILDEVLKDGRVRHDVIALIESGTNTRFPVRLLPANTPVPGAPASQAVRPAAPQTTPPVRTETPAQRPAPQATAAATFVEPRLGMEFRAPESGGRSAVIVRAWNTQPLPDGSQPIIEPGWVVDGLSAYAAGDRSLQRPTDNYHLRQSPADFETILDAILADASVRHDVVALTGGDLIAPLVIRLLPPNTPVPGAPTAQAARPAPSQAASPVRTETPAQRTAPQTTAATVIEPRLGMEFGRRSDNRDGAIVLRSWNERPLPNSNSKRAAPGQGITHIVSYFANPPNPQDPIENVAIVRGPQYVPIILDSILRSGRTRHDLVTLINESTGEAFPIPLLPANSPVPSAPPAQVAARPASPQTAPSAPEPSTAASLARTGIPTEEVEDATGFSLNLAITMTALAGLVLLAFVTARKHGWGRGFVLRPATVGPAVEALPEDEEEREIALARQAVERAEEETYRAPPPAETGGPSWFQQQRERREVERARQSMEEAERNAGRQPSGPHGHYPYPPPPYGYYPPRTPLSEWFRMAYWGLKIALVLVVAVWAWSVTGTVFSMLGAIVPAPLRAVTVDLLDKMQDAIQKADQGGQ